jgi:solute carrier family 20 (sodium-dependent phosphate transporter)
VRLHHPPHTYTQKNQVFSAICVVFSHGAGEVGYMAGPLGTILYVIRDGELPSKFEPPIWVILIGAFGLVFGLATYGEREGT